MAGIVGKGLTYPLELNSKGTAVLKEGAELIQSALSILFFTESTTRFFNRSFGTGLAALLEEPNDLILQSLATEVIIEALNAWETRIELLEIEYSRYEEHLNITLRYNIKETNEIDNFVFPYYQEIIY